MVGVEQITQLMPSWKISYEIKNFELDKPEIPIDNVVFHMLGDQAKEVVGTVTINGDNKEAAILEAKQIIDRAVTRLSVIHEGQFSIGTGMYIVDLANPSVMRVHGELRLLTSIGMDNVQDTRTAKLNNIDPNKQEVTDKVLGLYKIAQEIKNPFKAIDSYLGFIHAAIKDMYSPNFELKQGLKDILSKRDKNFDEQTFYKKYGDCYGRWRCGSSHGDLGLDVSNHESQEQATKDKHVVKHWAWEVLDEFLTRNQKLN